ncbi:MAG: C1 family peptidase [Leptospiraceae bacterium]
MKKQDKSLRKTRNTSGWFSSKPSGTYRNWSFWIAIITLVLLGTGLPAEGDFDPSSVRPRGCDGKEMDCGFNPTSPAAMRSVELAPTTQIRHRGLPSSVDLSSRMPPVGNQGQQGSCVAWAVAYAAKSYQERIERNWQYDSPMSGGSGQRVFSPAYVYNQINGGRDDGSVLDDAMQLAVQQGIAPWAAMPYNPNDFRRQPNSGARQQAGSFKARSFKRIPANNLDAVKAELASGNPVVFGIPVDDAFYNLRSGQVYDRKAGQNYGGHAMTLVGYDDSKRSPNGDVGAFKLINSWGTSWGTSGYGWISYSMWRKLNPYILVMYDIQESEPGPGPTPGPNPGPEESEKIEPPSNVTASRGTYSDRVEISWSAVSGAVVYIVFRADPGGTGFEQIAYAESTVHADRTVQANVAYKYLVVAVASEENYSDPERSTIVEGYAQQGGTTTPQQVSGLRASLRAVAGVSVSLNWNAVSGASRYQIARYNASNDSWAVLGTSTSPSYNDANPGNNQVTAYAVRAINSKGAGDWSEPVQVNLPGRTTKPEKPGSIEASKGIYNDRIEVEWNGVPGATAYAIFRYDYGRKVWEGPQKVTGTTFIDRDSSVRSGRWFAYVVVAANQAGNSGYSHPALGRANPNAKRAGLVLPPPENVKSNLKGENVSIQWDAVEGAAEYYVFRAQTRGRGLASMVSSADYEFVAAVPGNKTGYSEKIPGEAGDLFFYVIRTKAQLGSESENSRPVTAFRNPEPVQKRHRFLPGTGLERFTGTWKGEFFDGKMRAVEVKIQSEQDRFTITLSVDGRSSNYSGLYAAKSDVLEAGKLRVLADSEDFLLIESDESVPGLSGRSISIARSD